MLLTSRNGFENAPCKGLLGNTIRFKIVCYEETESIFKQKWSKWVTDDFTIGKMQSFLILWKALRFEHRCGCRGKSSEQQLGGKTGSAAFSIPYKFTSVQTSVQNCSQIPHSSEELLGRSSHSSPVPGTEFSALVQQTQAWALNFSSLLFHGNSTGIRWARSRDSHR